MFTFEITVIPASRISSMSCHRFGVPRARDVGVRQFVDQHHLRAAGDPPRPHPAR